MSNRTVRIPLKQIPKGGIGAGDLVAAVLKQLGVKPCDGCEQRRLRLNNKLRIRGSRG